ncbi:MAG: LPS assembly lipoprotein LptE [Candidatus Chlorobium antarcticum]|jgi:hypothetical protein|nr:LPS assembly lipoprotein LptE [Candidatus Chlorobium antarcticum]
MLKTVISRVLSSALLILFLGGCYSLGGGSLPEHIKTVAVPVFAGGYGYGNDLNRAVTNKIEAVTPLQITSSIARADALLECSITTWSDSSSQLSVDTERAITNRITIGVKASMDDRVEKEQMFSQSFVAFADYTVGDYLGQQEAIRVCMERIADQIIDAIVSGW